MAMKLVNVALAVASCLALLTEARLTRRASSGNLEALFGPHVSPGTEIASSSDSNFSSVVTGRWTSWEAPTFSGAIKPQTEHDLQAIVRIASANHIPFLATSGGHGAGLGYASVTGLDINLANFNSVSINTHRNELVVGAGVSIGDLIEPLYKAGKAVREWDHSLGVTALQTNLCIF